jgi:acetate kinase
MTAIKDGISIDHSLGFAPSNGLIMGTRSGDIDHSIVFYMVNTLIFSEDVNNLFQRKRNTLVLVI